MVLCTGMWPCDCGDALPDVYRRKPGRDDTWCPTVLGMQKRELLKDVAGIFGLYLVCGWWVVLTNAFYVARSKTFAKLGQDWQDLMKKVHADN